MRFALADLPAPPSPARPPAGPKPDAAPKSTGARVLKLPEVPFSYSKNPLPPHFLTPGALVFDAMSADNPITDWGATLGRVLFHDTRLSASDSVSCASCHQQERAFADSRRFLMGHAGTETDRNGMSLVNLRYTRAGFFWDIRAKTLEEQVLMPIQSRVEMGQSLEKVAATLRDDDRYPPLFEKAFQDSAISSDRIARAIAQFVRSMVSYRSRYDEGLVKVDAIEKDFPNYNADENLGKTLFLEKCAICHRDGRGTQSAHFSMFTALNNGIDRTGEELDAGRGDVTFIPSDVGLFKPSDLRNVERTAPYMHDGRFQTLEEVIDHYSEGVNRHPNVSGFIFRMNFNDQEKRALVAFLKTLTDDAFLNDPRFSNPWVEGTGTTAALAPTQTAAASTKPPATAPAAPRAPRGPMSAEERVQRLTKGEGLPAGEALPWLHSLDKDGDGHLSREETQPLAKLLAKNGTPPRFDRRRFALGAGGLRLARGGEAPPALMVFDKNKDGRVDREELPPPRRYLLEVGDADGDGRLSLEEARAVETLERFISLQQNDRDRTRVQRLIRSFVPSESRAGSIEKAFRELKTTHDQGTVSRNMELASRLEALMGADAYSRFQNAMLEKQDSRDFGGRGGGPPSLDAFSDQIFEFDADRDGRLNSSEQAVLASALDETPGGFGAPRKPLPAVKQFLKRVQARDLDHDGQVAEGELPERMRVSLMAADLDNNRTISNRELNDYYRKTGFERLLDEGIYTGGGFANAFSRSARLLKGLELPPEVADQAATLIDEHDRRLQASIVESVVATGRLLRDAKADRPGNL